MHLRSLAKPAAILLFCGMPAAVADPSMVLSYGSNNCERFSRAPDREKQQYLVWAEGFISALNTKAAGDARMAGMFWNRARNTVWLEAYCKNRPLQGFVFAAEALRTSIGGRNR